MRPILPLDQIRFNRREKIKNDRGILIGQNDESNLEMER
jgi:hypothetical protein